jgi:uncharacterized damage-inducible protein DinB
MMDRRGFVGVGLAAAWPRARSGAAPFQRARAFAERFEQFWNRNWVYTLEVADAMPAEEHGFRPVPAIRSFSEQLVHIAQANLTWTALIRGSPLEDPPSLEGIDDDPARVRHALDRSFELMLTSVLDRTDEELDRRVPWGRRLGLERSHSLRGVALTAWHHTAHQRGQCIIYLRLKGIEPPGYVD